MVITFIYHSAFLIETKRRYLLFDYFKGDIPKLNEDKPLYVFASHRHGDHFSSSVFRLGEEHKQVHYLLSDDISRKRVPEKHMQNIRFIGCHEQLTLDGMKVETLKSTDEGVAFLVETDGKRIYHAGDLNDWQWEGEEEQVNAQYRSRYREEISRLNGIAIDYAFLPLDPRQEGHYADGVDWFCRHVEVTWVFPMHCWEDDSVIERLKNEAFAEEYAKKIVNKTPFAKD